MPTELHQKQGRSRASPEIKAIRHTQDLFAALISCPQNLSALLASFDLQSRRIIEAIVFAFRHQSKTSDKQYLAMRGGVPWFKFSFVDPEGKTFSPRLHNFPLSGMPKNVDVVKCRKCGNDTFYLAITILQPSRFNGNPKVKMGYLTIECGNISLDHITVEDFGFRKE
ncbi:hypothetical protein J7J74_00930 [bacterium]|nr:hypothetical protein [bacterium]